MGLECKGRSDARWRGSARQACTSERVDQWVAATGVFSSVIVRTRATNYLLHDL